MSESPIKKSWYSVKCIIAISENKPWGPTDLAAGEHAYDERVTIWFAANEDEAISLAEKECKEHAEILEAKYAGLAQAYLIDGSPEHGSEIFSLIRRSNLTAPEYLNRFFDTGQEYSR